MVVSKIGEMDGSNGDIGLLKGNSLTGGRGGLRSGCVGGGFLGEVTEIGSTACESDDADLDDEVDSGGLSGGLSRSLVRPAQWRDDSNGLDNEAPAICSRLAALLEVAVERGGLGAGRRRGTRNEDDLSGLVDLLRESADLIPVDRDDD